MYGYYPCSPCLGVDRVFGFDVGIKKLSMVTEQALRKQMKVLCPCCGWFKEQQLAAQSVSVNTLSRSWKKAFTEYKKQKPSLSRF
jgi:hypothetical protein